MMDVSVDKVTKEGKGEHTDHVVPDGRSVLLENDR
jgi:hypothetical protein